jgi:PBP1b-binding outer membrane lipoprotein LpoB
MLLFATIFILFLAGCGEEVKTVQWYKEHEVERKAQLEKCKNNPGQLEKTPNCINARAAWNEIDSELGRRKKGIRMNPIK